MHDTSIMSSFCLVESLVLNVIHLNAVYTLLSGENRSEQDYGLPVLPEDLASSFQTGSQLSSSSSTRFTR